MTKSEPLNDFLAWTFQQCGGDVHCEAVVGGYLLACLFVGLLFNLYGKARLAWSGLKLGGRLTRWSAVRAWRLVSDAHLPLSDRYRKVFLALDRARLGAQPGESRPGGAGALFNVWACNTPSLASVWVWRPRRLLGRGRPEVMYDYRQPDGTSYQEAVTDRFNARELRLLSRAADEARLALLEREGKARENARALAEQESLGLIAYQAAPPTTAPKKA